MGTRIRQLTWPGHIQSLRRPACSTWHFQTDSKTLHNASAEYEPPFGLSPLMRRVLIACGLIDGYIEGLDEYMAFENAKTRVR